MFDDSCDYGSASGDDIAAMLEDTDSRPRTVQGFIPRGGAGAASSGTGSAASTLPLQVVKTWGSMDDGDDSASDCSETTF